MRYLKRTFIWVIVLTLLGGYYYLDLKREKVLEKKKDEATRLLPFSPNRILKIRLKKPESLIELERWEEGWRLTQPVQAPAVNEEVEKFLRYVTDFRNDSDYVMDSNPTDERLKEFGLDKPEVIVTLFTGKELAAHTILFGHRAPTKGVAFARLQGDPKIYRVLADAKSEADQDAYYFRNKTVVSYDPMMVDRLEVTTPSGSIHCELPIDGKWRIVEPVQARADITKVMELLAFFKNSEIKEFVEEEPEDLVKYKLKPETRKVSFRLSGDSGFSNEILLGKRDKKKRGVYARLKNRKNIVLLDDKILDYIPAEPFAIMNRELFSFEEDSVQSVRVYSGSERWEFEKKPDYSWERTHPTKAAVDFNPVMDFLQKTRQIKIKKFIPGNPALFKTTGLNRFAYKIQISMKGSGEEWITIGNEAKENGLYAMAGSGRNIFVIDREVVSHIQSFLGEMK